jgi:hypothetical protein
MYIEEQTGLNFSQDLLTIEGKKILQIHQKEWEIKGNNQVSMMMNMTFVLLFDLPVLFDR